MPIKTVSRFTFKSFEIGLLGTASHNLARYSVGASLAYTPAEFVEALESLMLEHGVESTQVDTWMDLIKTRAKAEEEFFINHKEFANSNGGTNITVESLFTPMLEGMGYTKEEN